VDGALARAGTPALGGGGRAARRAVLPRRAAEDDRARAVQRGVRRAAGGAHARGAPRASDEDLVATAVALTAHSVADAYARFVVEPCRRCSSRRRGAQSGARRRDPRGVRGARRAGAVRLFDEVFFDGEAKEAVAFALLGCCTSPGAGATCPRPRGRAGRACSARTPARRRSHSRRRVSASLAQLLIPALEADADGRFTSARARFEEGLALGVGGFLLYGGETDAVRALTKEAQLRARRPLLFAADLERGAGQQFSGATGLPPLAAIAWLDDMEALRRAARHTAREARTMGVNWNLAPVVDLDVDAQNPIVGTRSFGADPERVARYAAAWIEACQAEGCWPARSTSRGTGHRATTPISAHRLPAVQADARSSCTPPTSRRSRPRIAGDVAVDDDGGHVAYPRARPERAAATLSRELTHLAAAPAAQVDGLLAAVTPPPTALDMRGLLAAVPDEGEGARARHRAGCACCSRRRTSPPRRRGARPRARHGRAPTRRAPRWRSGAGSRGHMWAAPPNDWRRPTASDAAWGAQLCDRVVHAPRVAPAPLAPDVDVLVVATTGDGREATHGTTRGAAFVDTLRTAGYAPRLVSEPSAGHAAVVIATFPSYDAEHGDAQALSELRAAVGAACARALEAERPPVVALFAHPTLAEVAPPDVPLVCAWTGDAAMERAAARWLAANRG
jgi:beta-glucosidase